MSRRVVLLVVSGLSLAVGIVGWLGMASSVERPDAAATEAVSQPPALHTTGLLDQFNTEGLAVSREHILSGGPGKDGIPSLTAPKFAGVKDAAFLRDTDRVVVIGAGDEVHVYPLSILNWHEVVNDVVGQVPIAVVYCPLCDSVTVVDRQIAGKTLEFGVSGLLLNSNVLIYDRTDNALWSQAGLVAISGPHVGRSLKHLPWRITTAAVLRREHPDAQVLGTDTGYQRDYNRNPYAAYFTNDRLMFPVIHEDKRLGPKSRVVGIRLGNTVRAYPVDLIMSQPDRALTDALEGKGIVLAADPQAGVRIAKMPDDALVIHTFWFAWAAFHPTTDLYISVPDN